MLGNLLHGKAFTFGAGKTWAEVATVTTAEQTVDAPGVRVGDLVLVQKPTHQAGLAVESLARVAANDQLTIKFINPTAGGVTPTAGETWKALAFRPEDSLSTFAGG